MSATASSYDITKLAGSLASFCFASRPVIANYFRQNITIEGKADASPVTKADKEAEAAIRAMIAQDYPDHQIVGEEEGGVASGLCDWVIDPIDGTRAFICGKPTFGTLIALVDHHVPIAGVIDMPMMDEMYIGVKGQGATCNGVAIHTSTHTDLAKVRLASTAPEALSKEALSRFQALAERCLTASWGGDCYNYALLAAGHIDLVIEHQLASHDIMALVPVIEEAGGIVTDWDGKPVRLGQTGSLIAAANEALHEQALNAMQR